MFSNQNVAFSVDENENYIEIHDIVNRRICLEFKVASHETLLTVQTLLRGKMCELGFENKYRKIKMLGKGSSAEVHLVERVSDKKLFAAKIISIK
jgi:hypothetical protein